MACYFRVPLKITLRKQQQNQTTTKFCFCRYLSSFKSCQEHLANIIIKKIPIFCKSNSTSQVQQNYSVSVLVSADSFLCFFFFMVSSRILYFSFGRKTMSITQQHFSFSWIEPRTFQLHVLLVLLCQRGGLNRHRELERDRSRTADPTG